MAISLLVLRLLGEKLVHVARALDSLGEPVPRVPRFGLGAAELAAAEAARDEFEVEPDVAELVCLDLGRSRVERLAPAVVALLEVRSVRRRPPLLSRVA